MRLKLEENLPIQLRLLIEESGHDALTVLDQEIGGAKDAELASLCIAEERVLITLDTDFADIRMYPPGNHPGIDGCCRFVGGVKLRGIGGGFVRKMQGDVSDSQLHHRPHCPSKQGGTDHPDNLQLLCGACNSLKGDRPQEYLIARLREMGM